MADSPATPDVVGTIPLRERRTLAEEWEELAAMAMPSGASDGQRREMKRAFYAGAAGMFALLTGDDLDPDHEPTALDVAYVESLYQEIVAFSKALDDGTA